MESEYKYYAFISYKREDEKWAKWLQNKLETYKLPTSLAKETGEEIPKTFHPCFRDKTDLSETGDLSKILHEKLQQSKYLIVVCSPRSAKSKWVNKEVETFQEMGRADKIIPFIIEGNPDTSNPNVHCYPTTLDENILGISIPELGKEKAVVKTIAAMLNINFDTLWNRHRERVLKRKIQIAIFSVIFITLFGGFSAYQALMISESKNKIEEEYQRAEKLINAFYFYDGKFALAYNYNEFYFINKKGNPVEKLGYWKRAEQFHYGYAEVVDNNDNMYFLDTLANKYRYVDNIEDLDDEIQILNLSRQKIKRLPKEIGNLTNLTELYLYNFPLAIENVRGDKIRDVNHLTILYLNETPLKSLPPEIGKLTNLTKLFLQSTKLESLPPEIGRLTNLKYLSLVKTELESLPPEIGKLTNLTNLWLQTSPLKSLPPEIGKLTNLTQLTSWWNTELESLPPEIGNLINLTKLDLNATSLKNLPSEIGNLTNLTELVLSESPLRSLPPEIGKLTNLEKLWLGWNKELESLPPEVGNLTNLTLLYLTGTKLKSLPPEILKLTNLQIIGLDYDNLNEESKEIIDKLKKGKKE